MKKKAMSLILALILLLSCSATAQAISVQAATPSASITINGTTATCRVSIAKPGKSSMQHFNYGKVVRCSTLGAVAGHRICLSQVPIR